MYEPDWKNLNGRLRNECKKIVNGFGFSEETTESILVYWEKDSSENLEKMPRKELMDSILHGGPKMSEQEIYTFLKKAELPIRISHLFFCSCSFF